MLREDKEVFKTIMILILLSFLIAAFFIIEVDASKIKRLNTENETLYKKIFIGQGVPTNDEQIQDNSE